MWLLPSFLRGAARENIQLHVETEAHGPANGSGTFSNYSLVGDYLLRTYEFEDTLAAAKSEIVTSCQGHEEVRCLCGYS